MWRVCSLFAFFLLTAQAPRIDSIVPPQGPIAGGTSATIGGANLTGGVVTVDGALVGADSASDTAMVIPMPRHENGYAFVRVQTPAGTATTTFLYVPPALRDLPPGFITTVAGVGDYNGDYRPAIDAAFVPGAIATVRDGTLYIADAGHRRVVRVRPDGILEPLAGSGAPFDIALQDPRSLFAEPSGDVEIADDIANVVWHVDVTRGEARVLASGLDAPVGVTGNGRGTLWVAQSGSIVRVDEDGTVTTIAGTGARGFSGDGAQAIEAQVDPSALAYDDENRLLYVVDGGVRIRRIDLRNGIIDTFLANMPARAMLADGSGDLFVATNGKIVHVARDGTTVESWTTTGTAAGLAFDPTRNLLYSDDARNRVFRIARPNNAIDAVAGVDGVFGENGPALGANAIENVGRWPDVYAAPNGEVIFGGKRIRKIGLDGRLSVVAPTPGAGIDGHFAATYADVVRLDAVQPVVQGDGAIDVAADPAGNLFIAEPARVRRLDANSGVMTTVLDNVTPFGIAFGAGDLFIALRDRVMRSDGTTILGVGGGDFFTVDAAGSVYGLLSADVVRVTPAGVLQRLVGRNDAQHGFGGDGGPASDALLQPGGGISIDAEGNLYFVDGGNRRIRAVRYGAVLPPPNATISAAANGSVIRASVHDAIGQPAPSVRVDFHVPASGASCVPASPFAITDANGVATMNCTPNCIAGSYVVTAQTIASDRTATATMTNGACKHRAAGR